MAVKKAAVKKAAAKLVVKKPKPKLTRFDKFIMGLVALYPFDFMAPGFVFSYVQRSDPAQSKFYGSIVRYDEPHDAAGMTATERAQKARKQVLVSTLGDSMEEVQDELIRRWKSGERNPVKQHS